MSSLPYRRKILGTCGSTSLRNRSSVSLTRIKLDDQLLVDQRLHFFPGRNMRDLSGQRIAIDRQPIGDRRNLRQLHIAHRELARFRFVLHRNFVAGFEVERRNIDALAIDLHVSMRNQLPRRAARVRQAEPENDVVEAGLKKLQEGVTGYATPAERGLENP